MNCSINVLAAADYPLGLSHFVYTIVWIVLAPVEHGTMLVADSRARHFRYPKQGSTLSERTAYALG
jgi:hypothetical protein